MSAVAVLNTRLVLLMPMLDPSEDVDCIVWLGPAIASSAVRPDTILEGYKHPNTNNKPKADVHMSTSPAG